MATYYKYVERNAKDRINWNEVGKSVSDMLNEEAKVRLDKKAEIDENSRQFGIELANAPVGDYDHGNTFINGFATDMTEYRRMQDNLLKSGQLNLGDYTRNRQNNTDGTKLTFDLATTYQEAYTDKMNRWKSGESQYREVYEMESVEGLANMRTTGSFINPTNGVVSLATRDKNGGLDMNNTRTAAEMYGSIKRNYDAYDVNAAVKSEVDYLGDYIISDLEQALSSRKLSSVSQLTDQKEAPGYTKWENDTVSSIMADTDHITSMLTNNLLQTDKGLKYTYTDNETDFINDKSGTLIYLDKSVDAAGKPVFKPEQEKAVEDFVRNRIQQQIDVKLDIATAGYKPQANQQNAATIAAGDKKDAQQNVLMAFAKLRYGNEAEKRTAANYIKGVNPTIKGFDFTKDDVTIRYTDDSGLDDQPIPYNDSNAAFVESGINYALPTAYKILDVNEALERGGGFGNQEPGIFTTNFTVEGISNDYESVMNTLQRELKNTYNVDASVFVEGDEDTTKENIDAILAGTPGLEGYTSATSNAGVSEVTITRGEEQPIIFNLEDNTPAELAQKLRNIGINSMEENQKKLIVQGKRKRKTPTGTSGGTESMNLLLQNILNYNTQTTN